MLFWKLMVYKDDLIIRLSNGIFYLVSFLNISVLKAYFKEYRPKGGSYKGQSLYLILNGPSLQNQDLSILIGENVMFVNRGFKHTLFKQLQPKFHVIVDPKFKSGEWPVYWLDEIIDLSPDISFVMPISWINLSKLKPYIQKGVSFIWLPESQHFSCLGVSGKCFQTAIHLGFDKCYFTGFDGNGIAYELIKRNSHFYGKNDENDSKNYQNYVFDLLMHSRHLRELNLVNYRALKKNLEIYNLTDGGLLDMFPRKEFNTINLH